MSNFNSSNSNQFAYGAAITNPSLFGSTYNSSNGGQLMNFGTGQLGLNKRLNHEVIRKTYVTPQGVKVEETITVNPLPYHFPHSIAGETVEIRETVRTREIVRTLRSPSREVVRGLLLSPTSTGDRMFDPNDGIFQTDAVSYPMLNQNRSNHSISNNQMNYPINRIRHIGSQPSHQNPIHHNSFQFQNLRLRDISSHPNLFIEELDESPNGTQGNEVLSPTPLTAVYGSSENDDPIALQNQNLGRHNNARRRRNREDAQAIVSDDRKETKYDGKTHSLPYQKYGPYTCPKCMHSFPTSQCFAAHMNTHYKHESKEERRTRLLAKYGKKYLKFQELEHPIPTAFVHNPFIENGNVEMSAQPKKGPIVEEEASSEDKGANNASPSRDAIMNNDADSCVQVAPLREAINGNGFSDVKVKAEYVEP